MVTIKDVAKVAGVSTCTVSRVLSNTGYIAPKTRDKVGEAIKQLKYYPNNIARDFKLGSSNTIALIVPDITNYFYMEWLRQ